VPQIRLPVRPHAWATSSRYTGRHHRGIPGGIIPEQWAASSENAAVETDLKNPLYLCVNLPKAALFRSVGECIQFFDED
jgi:hypothetical protein